MTEVMSRPGGTDHAGRTPTVVTRIRPAGRDDVPAIVTLLAEDPIGADREDTGPHVHDAYWEAFDRIRRDPRNQLVVAERNGEVIGTLQLIFIASLTRRGGERAEIEGVRVRADARGDGLGRELVTWAIAQARGRGCRLVQLTTDKRRADAHGFYTSLGFRATHEGMKLAL